MAKLVLRSGNGPREIALDDKPLSVGRRPDNRLKLEDNAASGRHASISLRNGGYWIEDLNSSNGTFLNGQRVTGLKALGPGDRLTFGKTDYEFHGEEISTSGTMILQAPLIPQAPPPPARPAAETATPKVSLPDPPTRPVSADAARDLARLGATDVSMLDALVGSIRSHRDREKTEQERRQAEIKVQWDKTLTYAEQLKVKVGADPRVKYFAVSRRANDVMIRFQRSASAPVEMLYLSLQHPDQPDHALTGIWYRRSGSSDRCLQSADEAAMELVKEMAFLIA